MSGSISGSGRPSAPRNILGCGVMRLRMPLHTLRPRPAHQQCTCRASNDIVRASVVICWPKPAVCKVHSKPHLQPTISSCSGREARGADQAIKKSARQQWQGVQQTAMLGMLMAHRACTAVRITQQAEASFIRTAQAGRAAPSLATVTEAQGSCCATKHVYQAGTSTLQPAGGAQLLPCLLLCLLLLQHPSGS